MNSETKSSIIIGVLIGMIIVLSIIGNNFSEKSTATNEINQNQTVDSVVASDTNMNTSVSVNETPSNQVSNLVCITEESSDCSTIISELYSETIFEEYVEPTNNATDYRNYIGEGYVDINSGVLNLRNSTTTNSEILAEIPKDTNLTLYSSDTEGWYYTFYEAKYGYVSADYITFFETASTTISIPEEGPLESEYEEETTFISAEDILAPNLDFLDDEFLNCQGYTYAPLSSTPIMYKGVYYSLVKEKNEDQSWWCTIYSIDKSHNKKILYSSVMQLCWPISAVIFNDRIYIYCHYYQIVSGEPYFSYYDNKTMTLNGFIENEKTADNPTFPINDGVVIISDYITFSRISKSTNYPVTTSAEYPNREGGLAYIGEYNEFYYFVCNKKLYYFNPDINERHGPYNSYPGSWNYVCEDDDLEQFNSFKCVIGRYAISKNNKIIDMENNSIIETDISSVFDYINNKYGVNISETD